MYTPQLEAFIAKQKFPPNPFQRQVLESVAFGSGNIVVSALAGSGKTTLLVQIAELMADMGISGEQVLFMAFNVKIADELNKRLPKGFSAINSHKIGNRALGNPKPKLSYTKSRSIAEELVNAAFDVNTYTQSQRFSAQRTLEDLTSKVMLSLTNPQDTLGIRALAAHHGMFDGDNFTEDKTIIPLIVSLVPQMMGKMERVFENTREINFDEMLYIPVKRNLIKPSFDWVLVDECQDLNAAQQEIVFQSIKSGGRIISVGDIHQAIYGFAGADAYAFDNLIERSDGQLLPLNICYRCPSSHLQYARAIVPDILPRENAPFGEIKFIDDADIPALAQPGNLIMSRVTAPLVKFYFELIRARKPAQVLGRDIGGDLIKTLDKVAERTGFQFDSLNHFLDVYKNEQLNSLRQRENSANAVQVLEDKIETLQTCVTEFACPDMPTLKRELSKLFGTGRNDEEEREGKRADLITLLTVHRAKGLEADVTFIVKPEKMPLQWEGQHAWQLAQEMNILYVALTRAKKVMHIAGELAVRPQALEGETLAPVSTGAKDTPLPIAPVPTGAPAISTPEEPAVESLATPQEEAITHAPTPAEAPLLPAVEAPQPVIAQHPLAVRCKLAEGRLDNGAEHRAIMLASALKAAGLWDDIGEIWFHDAYEIHSAHYGVRALPLEQLVLERRIDGLHVSLPQEPAEPVPAPQPEAEEEILYAHPCIMCDGTGESGKFACDDCDGSGTVMLPFPYLYEESDEGALITDDTTLPAELHGVRAHLRALPPGKRASRQARKLASQFGINLAEYPGYTFVRPHERIDEPAAPRLALEVSPPVPILAMRDPSPKPLANVLARLAAETELRVLSTEIAAPEPTRPEATPTALVDALMSVDTATLDTLLSVLNHVKRLKSAETQAVAV